MRDLLKGWHTRLPIQHYVFPSIITTTPRRHNNRSQQVRNSYLSTPASSVARSYPDLRQVHGRVSVHCVPRVCSYIPSPLFSDSGILSKRPGVVFFGVLYGLNIISSNGRTGVGKEFIICLHKNLPQPAGRVALASHTDQMRRLISLYVLQPAM